MATTLDIPAGGLLLRGWPLQPYKYSSKESTTKRTAVLLQVNKRVIQELQQCARNGDTMKLLSGRTPKLQYGSKSLSLDVQPEAYTHELYRSADGNADSLSYVAAVTQRASLSKTVADTAGTDAALANLKQSLASFAQDKEAKSATISSAVLPTTKSNKILSSQYLTNASRNVSQGSSPLHGANRAGLAPTSAPAIDPAAAAKQKAMTFALSHLLSSRPLSDEQIATQTRIPQPKRTELLQRVAEQDRTTREWRLKDKAYKDLDLWKFNFPHDEDREAAIDNAIRALDRLRLSKDDKIWQQLLPVKERGKGKCLSRLHNNIHLAATIGPHFGAPSPQITATEAPALTGRLTPLSSTPMARTASATSKSNSSIEKRLKDSQKARAVEEAKAKREAKAAVSPPKNTNKIITPKSTAKLASKYKSAETVHSSDESSGEMGLISGKQRSALMAAKSNNGRSPLGSSSSDTNAVKDQRKPVIARAQVSPEKVVKATAAQGLAAKDKPSVTTATKSTPVTARKVAPSQPSSVRPSAGTPVHKAEIKTKKPASSASTDLFGGHERQPVVRKVVGGKTPGGKTPLGSTPQTTSPSYSAPNKPKNTSPLARGNGNTPNMFGGYDRPAPVIKKVVTSADKSSSKPASAPAAGTTDAGKKRPAPPSDDTDRPRKAVKASPAPAAAPVSLKRKADDATSPPAPANNNSKHRRTESSSTQSVVTYSSSSGNSHTTTARTSVASPSPRPHDEWARSPSANSSLSEGGKVSWERALSDAERFRTTLFPRYQKLYDKLAAMREEEIRREEREELWRMHVELKELKRVFRSVASA